MTIALCNDTYKREIPNFQSNGDIANLISSEYDKAVKTLVTLGGKC